jgi:predicted ribosomally synthesized peptide with SipW-like signal peptide
MISRRFIWPPNTGGKKRGRADGPAGAATATPSLQWGKNMNRKLILGAVAGVAAIGLAVGGTTYAAYSDFGDVNGNSIGAGILKLDLTSGTGGAATAFSFGNLAPDNLNSNRAVYIASSDGSSVPPADLYVTLQNVKNYDNGCSSASEAQDDPGCLTADKTSADPAKQAADDGTQGELARVLNVRVESFASTSAAQCAGYSGGAGTGAVINSAVVDNEVGALADPANLNHQVLISDPAHPLTAGQGVCLVFFTYWPKTQDPAHSYDGATLPTDNAAQGDSLTFDAHFDLTQH